MKLFEECRFCDKRYVGCPANCPTYIRNRKRLENDYIEYCKLAIRNMKRKRRRP